MSRLSSKVFPRVAGCCQDHCAVNQREHEAFVFFASCFIQFENLTFARLLYWSLPVVCLSALVTCSWVTRPAACLACFPSYEKKKKKVRSLMLAFACQTAVMCEMQRRKSGSLFIELSLMEKVSDTECVIILPRHFLEIEVCQRNVRSGFRLHSRIAGSEASFLDMSSRSSPL